MKESKRVNRPDFSPASRVPPTGNGDARPKRRYSARIEAIVAAQTVRPEQPKTWEPSWATAFNELKDDGEIHRDKLAELLIKIGHSEPDESLVKSIAAKVSQYHSLPPAEVYEFIQIFEAELREELRKAFVAAAEMGAPLGKVLVPELEELVKRRGYTPIPYAVREVLSEAAQQLGESISGGVTLSVFEKMNELLEPRQGFCKTDLDILEGAFQRFDKDKSGTVESRELRDLLNSLDFCLDEGVVQSLVEQPLRDNSGVLTWKDFLSISRKRVRLEFDLCQVLFKRSDDDEDGLLKPGELLRVFSQLGVSFLPETFADITEECGIDGDSVDFNSFWMMLQVLRGREGFTIDEADFIHEVFDKFDSTGRGEMPLKRVPAAMIWLGYQAGPGTLGKASKQVEIPSTGYAYMTEAQFMKLARKHREAQLRAIRKVYRTFAEDGGAGKLYMENLQAAVTRLNRLFVNDFLDWIKMYRPGARFAKKHICFDFEEFRVIVLYCCEKLRTRIHKNCGYSEVQLSKLRIEFVKYTKDGSSTEVDVAGLMRLFKSLFPQAQTSPTVRNRLRKALESNSARNTGLDWHTFLRVMRAYEDYVEVEVEQCIQDSLGELDIPEECVEEAQELIARLLQGAKASHRLLPDDVVFLAQSIAPQLTEDEADEAIERLYDAEREGIDGEFKAVSVFKEILFSGDLYKRSELMPREKSHDVLCHLLTH